MKHIYANIKTGMVYVGAKELNGERMDLLRKGELIKVQKQNTTLAVLRKKDSDTYKFKVVQKKEWRTIPVLKEQGWDLVKEYSNEETN